MGVDPSLERRVRSELILRDGRARHAAHLRIVVHAPGTAARIARVVGRTALADLLRAGHPAHEHLAAFGVEA